MLKSFDSKEKTQDQKGQRHTNLTKKSPIKLTHQADEQIRNTKM